MGEHKPGTAVLKLVCRVTQVRESQTAHTASLDGCFKKSFNGTGTALKYGVCCKAKSKACLG